MNPFDAQIEALNQRIAQMQQSAPSQQEYYDAQAQQMAAQNKQRMAQMLMNRGKGGTTPYDALSALISGYMGAKSYKDAETTWTDASKKAAMYKEGQKKLEAARMPQGCS